MPHAIFHTVPSTINILLAEDDADDYLLFQTALHCQTFKNHLNRVTDGDQLMEILQNEKVLLPDIIFLDINHDH